MACDRHRSTCQRPLLRKAYLRLRMEEYLQEKQDIADEPYGHLYGE